MGAAAPALGSVPASAPAGAMDPFGAIVPGTPGAPLIAGVSLDGGTASGAGVMPGVDPKATIAIAATTTHAVAAARPTRPARRRGRDLAPGAAAATRCVAAGWTGGCVALSGETVPGWAAGRRAGCLHASRRSTVGWLATGPPRRSRYGSAAAPAPRPGPDSAPPITGSAMPAGKATTWREVGGSTSRKGAHLRHAASTRFQQSAQHAEPQIGQSR